VNWLLILPIGIPMATAIASALMVRHYSPRRLHVLSCAALLITSILLLREVVMNGIQVVQVGNWPAPFGITLVADVFSAAMVVVTGVIAFAVSIYSLWDPDPLHEKFGEHLFLQLMLAGISGAFLTGDLFNLYVWFELLLIASFVLMALGGERRQIEAAIKYVAINLIASTLFLSSIALLYGNVGTLNMAQLSLRLPDGDPRLTLAAALTLLVAFGIKAAVFPLYFWLPASYHTPPHAVSAIFAGLLTKVGVYALIRSFTLIFPGIPMAQTILLIVAGLTMITGVLGAVSQTNIRRLLSFHIISQIGYMVLGLAIYTPLAVAGAIFYIIHHIIVKTNLFLIAGAVERVSGNADVRRMGGLYRARPFFAFLFLVPALSLAGLPPLSGFFAKLSLIRAGIEASHALLVFVALAVGLLTLFSMMKIWGEAFWKPAPEGSEPALQGGLPWLPIGGLAALTLFIGIVPTPLFDLAMEASRQLLDPADYVFAVLGVTS
jgi:multicomponent Na+:H+ antiporter subunit D